MPLAVRASCRTPDGNGGEAIQLARLVAIGAVVGAAGGVLFCAIHGNTTYHRAIAYGLWVAAAGILLAMPLVGSKRFYRATNLPLVEGWVFVGAATTLTVLGALIDAVGT
jgi:hypothetical protein